MLKEFREFVARGNVFDLAVAVVIGASFNAVVQSFVNDVMMPPIGMIMGGVDFNNLYLNLSGEQYASVVEATEAGAPIIRYGTFLNTLLVFFITAFAVFLLVRSYNRLRRQQETAPAAPTDVECPFCRFMIPIGARRCAHCTSEIRAA